MPLREEEPSIPTQRGSRGSKKSKTVLIGIGVLALLLIVYLVLPKGAAQPGTAPSASSSPGETVASATNEPDPGINANESEWSKTQTDTRLNEVGPGLARCLSVVDGNQTSAVDGVRVGFPQTFEGGVSAILNYTKYQDSLPFLLPDVAAKVEPHIYGDDPSPNNGAGSPEFRTNYRKELKINDQGDALLDDGQIDPHNAVYYDSYPEYGAYHVDRVSYTQNGLPYYMVATVWMPRVLGHGNDDDMSQVSLRWVTWQMAIEWVPETEEWHSMLSVVIQESPQPANPTFSNQTFAARAKALGPGWCVPADARQDAVPGFARTK